MGKRHYTVAFILRVFLALFYWDPHDFEVFLATAEDIFVLHRPLYYEGSPQILFNYFPIAYIPVLSLIWIYFLVGFKSIYLQRLFLKLPMILADLATAYSFRRFAARHSPTKNPSFLEFAILFNPFLLVASAIKGQFDVFVLLLAVHGLDHYLSARYFSSGVLFGLAVMLKVYALFLPFFCLLDLLKRRNPFLTFTLGGTLAVAVNLSIGVFIGFNVMWSHAVLYHLNRRPIGYSIPAFAYEIALMFGRTDLQHAIELLATLMLFLSLIILTICFWRHPDPNLPSFALAGFLLFIFLNKVFWLQYLAMIPGYLAWMDLTGKKRITDKVMTISVVISPFALVFRPDYLISPELKSILGPHWLLLLILIAILVSVLFTLSLRHMDRSSA